MTIHRIEEIIGGIVLLLLLIFEGYLFFGPHVQNTKTQQSVPVTQSASSPVASPPINK